MHILRSFLNQSMQRVPDSVDVGIEWLRSEQELYNLIQSEAYKI